jgi:hypothetical protein
LIICASPKRKKNQSRKAARRSAWRGGDILKETGDSRNVTAGRARLIQPTKNIGCEHFCYPGAIDLSNWNYS